MYLDPRGLRQDAQLALNLRKAALAMATVDPDIRQYQKYLLEDPEFDDLKPLYIYIHAYIYIYICIFFGG